MFGKNDKKAVVKFEHESEGYSGSSTTIPLKDGSLLEHLNDLIERHGALVIKRITSFNELHISIS